MLFRFVYETISNSWYHIRSLLNCYWTQKLKLMGYTNIPVENKSRGNNVIKVCIGAGNSQWQVSGAPLVRPSSIESTCMRVLAPVSGRAEYMH